MRTNMECQILKHKNYWQNYFKTIVFISSFLVLFCFHSFSQLPTVSILGDSYSTFEGYTTPLENEQWYFKTKRDRTDVEKVEQTWWWILCDEYGLQLEINNSYSGSTISYSGYYGRDYKDRSFITRAPNIGNPDIILVFGATNDDWAGAPLGTLKYEGWSEEDLYFFRPAMTYLANYLTDNHPKAKIYFIVNDCLKDEITATIREVCNHYGISVVELRNIAKKTSHPTVAGMRQIAEQVGTALKPKE